MMNTGVNSKIDIIQESELDNEERGKFSFSESMKELMFYVLPIISFFGFVLIVLLAVVPNFNITLAGLDEVEGLSTEDTRLKNRIEKIQKLNDTDNTYQSIINKIDSIVPVGKTEVVKFTNRISQTVISNGLTMSEIKTGEEELLNIFDAINTTGTEEDGAEEQEDSSNATRSVQSTLGVRQIPIKFSITGTFYNIRKFFADIYKGRDFFVVEKMDLSTTQQEGSTGDTTIWSCNLVLVKYQFVPPNDFKPEIAYGNITEDNELNEKVVDFLNKKFVGDIFTDNAINSGN